LPLACSAARRGLDPRSASDRRAGLGDVRRLDLELRVDALDSLAEHRRGRPERRRRRHLARRDPDRHGQHRARREQVDGALGRVLRVG
jgi:hypothetical protein